jgi:hypothetical protein
MIGVLVPLSSHHASAGGSPWLERLQRSGVESKREIFNDAGFRDDVAKLVSSFFQGMLKRNFKNCALGIFSA